MEAPIAMEVEAMMEEAKEAMVEEAIAVHGLAATRVKVVVQGLVE